MKEMRRTKRRRCSKELEKVIRIEEMEGVKERSGRMDLKEVHEGEEELGRGRGAKG